MEQKPHHPADIADELERLTAREAQQELRDLGPEDAAAVLAELEEESRPAVLEGMSNSEVAAILSEMPHEDAADVLAEIPLSQQAAVLENLPAEDQGPISRLMTYPPDTAGGIMTDQYLTLRSEQTVECAIQHIRNLGEEYRDQVLYLYVTEGAGKLVGIVSLHDLVFKRPERKIADVMRTDVAHVFVDDDQEHVAQLFERYHYMLCLFWNATIALWAWFSPATWWTCSRRKRLKTCSAWSVFRKRSACLLHGAFPFGDASHGFA
ncbi:MAG TPA: CBS domain-containing protein [Methylomirabilota bacterium]|nr:CBS domain-containing protein [Methylomirabilota bacterium]